MIADRAALVADLRTAVRAAAVSTLHDELVVAPPTSAALLSILRIARAHGASISLADGGGPADISVDLASHLHHVKRIDPIARTVRVDAGALVGDVRAAAANANLAFLPDRFVPDAYTIARAFDEGLIVRTDPAAEAHLIPGVRSMVLATYGGRRMHLSARAEDGAPPEPERDALDGAFVRALRDLRDAHADSIRSRFSTVPWVIAGYDLAALLDERGFNLAEAASGSHGTLGIAIELTCELDLPAAARTSIAMAFSDVAEAAAHAPFVQSYGATAVYGFEAAFAASAGVPNAPWSVLDFTGDRAWLLAEFARTDIQDACAAAESLQAANEHRYAPAPCVAIDAPLPRDWLATGNAALPLDVYFSCSLPDLGTVLGGIEKTARDAGLPIVIHGDFAGPSVGLSVRCETDAEQRADLLEAALAVAQKNGGLAASASGKATTNADAMATLFGPDLAQSFAEFACAFDPTGQMNPAATRGARAPGAPPVAATETAGHAAERAAGPAASALTFAAAALCCILGFRIARWFRER